MIVTHEGRGWFDPVNGSKGDVLALAQLVWGGTLGHARKSLRPLAGLAFFGSNKANSRGNGAAPGRGDLGTRGAAATGFAGVALPDRGAQPLSRHGPACACPRRSSGGHLRHHLGRSPAATAEVTGWEMRGPNYKGFAKGGRKRLFRVGAASPDRIAVTESAIDALSLAMIEGWRAGTLYVSTGGGWGGEASELLQAVLSGTARLVIATDRGSGGDLMASRLADLASGWGVVAERLYPDAHDWNDQVRAATTPLTLALCKRVEAHPSSFPPAQLRLSQHHPSQGGLGRDTLVASIV